MNGDVGVTSKPAARVDNERPVGVLPTDLCPVVGGERVDAANVVLWLNTGGAVTKVVCSVGNTGGGGGIQRSLVLRGGGGGGGGT